MEAAPDARRMLRLHAAHVRSINERSAAIALVVEQAAATGDAAVVDLWSRMTHNRAFGVRSATETLLSTPERRPLLARSDIKAAFWVALDWGTFRTLTDHAGLSGDAYERRLRAYYRSMLLAR
jgi:hypothetical protein